MFYFTIPLDFQIIPAIDLIGGRCVRLYKGSYSQKTEYPISPAEQARYFAAAGATMLHVVDLDGARLGHPHNLKTIAKIRQAVQIPIEVGGGVRSTEAAEQLLALGIDRVILGTAAVEDPDLLQSLLGKCGSDQIVVGLDAKVGGSKIATRGWETGTGIDVLDFAQQLQSLGVTRIAYTDIARDGTLTSPNFEMNEKLVQLTQLRVIASGGVTKIAHLKMLRDIGCEGAILGKALYEHELDLAAAVEALRAD